MQVAWLERLLADRGIHGKIIEARLVSSRSDVMLDVRTYKTNDAGRRLALFDGATPGSLRAAEERHVIPVAGMVFDVSSQPTEASDSDVLLEVTSFGDEERRYVAG